MPAESALTPMGVTWRGWLPVVLRDSPEHLAVIHAVAKETERLEAAIESVRAQFWPQTATFLLKAWEAMLRLAMEPGSLTEAQRRDLALVYLRKLHETGEGRDWKENVSLLVGPGWSYEEHIPGDGASPPAYTLRITLPFPPSGDLYARTERLLREVTPAHLDLILQSSGGFVLDQSQLDQEGLA